MGPLPRHCTTDFSVYTVSVTRSGTISVRGVLYTVPSRLVGCRLKVHVYDDRLICYLGTTPVMTAQRRYYRRRAPPAVSPAPVPDHPRMSAASTVMPGSWTSSPIPTTPSTATPSAGPAPFRPRVVRPRDDRQRRAKCPQGQPPHPPPPAPAQKPKPFFLIVADPFPKLSLHTRPTSRTLTRPLGHREPLLLRQRRYPRRECLSRSLQQRPDRPDLPPRLQIKTRPRSVRR
jgi:hypothetical protein